MLVPLAIPPGAFNHGTDFENSNRWLDMSLVRWRNGSLRAVGGWEAFTDESDDQVQLDDGTLTQTIPRGALSWFTNSRIPYVAFGTYNKLYALSGAGVLSDITPTAFTVGRLTAGEVLGYGGKAYGVGAYGTARQPNGQLAPADTWTLDTWGEYLVGCCTGDGELYEWQLNTATPAAPISNAPSSCSSLCVTAERILMALGAGGNPRQIEWSDREDNTQWTPAATNEAGDFQLQTTGVILRGLRVRGRTLILTTTDAHTATYLGPPFVYGFEQAGYGCGLVAPLGVVSIGDRAFWMGENEFFMYDGSRVQVIPCPIADYVFDDVNSAQANKAFAVSIQQHSEVWWFYPSSGSEENDRYAAYDYGEGVWHFGELPRASGVDSGVFTTPVMAGVDGNVWLHETGLDYGGSTPFAETGPLSIGNGDQVFTALQMLPDERTRGEVTATFKVRFSPNGAEESFGPYTMADYVDLRFTGRQMRMRVEGVADSDWRVGTNRVEVALGGGR